MNDAEQQQHGCGQNAKDAGLSFHKDEKQQESRSPGASLELILFR